MHAVSELKLINLENVYMYTWYIPFASDPSIQVGVEFQFRIYFQMARNLQGSVSRE